MLSPKQLESLATLVDEKALRTDQESCLNYGRDWTRVHQPNPAAVVLPKSVEEVQAIVRWACAEQVALVPSGGRSGLSAGAVAANGELVLALDRLNEISDFDATDRTVRCGAGVVTAQLQEFAQAEGLFYPVDFASSGSSQIGGNIATNAGGIKVIRYGMTRDWVAGLKVVTGTGELLDLNRGLIKNNAGYDLRHLMIGSEGTLGIIVEATMRLEAEPAERAVMVLGTPDMASIMEVLRAFRDRVRLEAFEFFSEEALAKVVEHQDLTRPFATASHYYALLEFEKPDDVAEASAMECFEHCVDAGWVEDGVISQSLAQASALWRLREDISETISRWTPYKNDISTTVSRVPSLLTEVEGLVSDNYPDFEIIWFGHIGDGNVHLNILKPDAMPMEEFQTRCGSVSQGVFESVARHGGSISAEHGVGLLKKPYLGYSRSDSEINLMAQLKRVFDPAGIMNPGKILDA
ncbi:FAD-binding oxidoreductase [Congregibacter brevis]|uniref:FAD-binding oxidoreductase n=1 Tax=Congregibacter brevis TaxID=3081201 RepID=A0ABZ0IDM8_9GAMM|nr:FAD-binding oxidoreductase [Congregibacter sp. IMCC45268]